MQVEKNIKHYVEFLYPGVIISECSQVEISSRDIEEIYIPNHAYGFRFLDKTHAIIDGTELVSQPENYSNWHYEGEFWSLEYVEEHMPHMNVLIDNMKTNNWNRVIRTHYGQCFPVEDDAQIFERSQLVEA